MTQYEMTEKLSEKMNTTMEEAKAALEASDWNMLDAALALEQQRGSRQADAAAQPGKCAGRKIADAVRGLIARGNRNRFAVTHGGDTVLELPVTVLALLLIFAFWACVPMLVIGLFAGCRYRFNGQDLGREGINGALDKAADAADRMKQAVEA